MEEHIQRNIERWNVLKRQREERAEKLRGQAAAQLFTELARVPREREIKERMSFILAERKAKWMLKNCRASIGELVAQHEKMKKNG